MSMSSCIEAKKFGFLNLKLRLGTYFDSPMLSLYIQNQSHHPNFAKSYPYIIGAFHRALGGCTFGYKLQENVACPIASEYNIGLMPSHTNPQLNKTSIKANQNCPLNISTFSQFRAPKDEENTPMGSKKKNSRIEYLLVGVN